MSQYFLSREWKKIFSKSVNQVILSNVLIYLFIFIFYIFIFNTYLYVLLHNCKKYDLTVFIYYTTFIDLSIYISIHFSIYAFFRYISIYLSYPSIFFLRNFFFWVFFEIIRLKNLKWHVHCLWPIQLKAFRPVSMF